MKFRSLILLLFVVCSFSGYAQYDTVHYVAPTFWSFFNDQNEVILSTLEEVPFQAEVFNSDGTLINQVTLVKGEPARLTLNGPSTVSQVVNTNTVLQSEGLVCRGPKSFSVNLRNVSGDNFLPNIKGNTSITSKGELALGTNFRLIYFRNIAAYYGILAKEDNTQISRNGTPLVVLQAGESYLIGSDFASASIGDHITSTKPISITSSHPDDSPGMCADPVGDQLIPANFGGFEHITVRGAGTASLAIELTTIVATEDTTVVLLNGVPNTVLLDAGDFVTISNGANEFDVNFIETDKPVVIAQGAGQGCEHGMSVIPPLGCTGSKHIETLDFGSLDYTVFVLSKCDDVAPVLNGTVLSDSVQVFNTPWYLYTFNNTNVLNDTIILDSKSPMHVGILQDGGQFGAFAYFSRFSKKGIQISAATNDGSSALIEGCNATADFSFIRETYCGSIDTVQINVGGTAVEGEDFTEVDDLLIFEDGVDTLSFTIEAFADGVDEGQEFIAIEIYADKDCDNIIDTISSTLFIDDYRPLKLAIDQTEIDMCVDFTDCSDISDVREIKATVSDGKAPYFFNWENGVQEGGATSPYTSTNFLAESLNNVPALEVTYALFVTDACGNAVSTTYEVENNCPMCAPNVITPNVSEDNANTFFKIENIEQYPEARVSILNRWGNIVFETENYQNEFDGQELSDGVYYYQVSIEGKSVLNGFFHIIR